LPRRPSFGDAVRNFLVPAAISAVLQALPFSFVEEWNNAHPFLPQPSSPFYAPLYPALQRHRGFPARCRVCVIIPGDFRGPPGADASCSVLPFFSSPSKPSFFQIVLFLVVERLSRGESGDTRHVILTLRSSRYVQCFWGPVSSRVDFPFFFLGDFLLAAAAYGLVF